MKKMLVILLFVAITTATEAQSQSTGGIVTEQESLSFNLGGKKIGSGSSYRLVVDYLIPTLRFFYEERNGSRFDQFPEEFMTYRDSLQDTVIRTEAVVMRTNASVKDKDVIQSMDEAGYRPARMHEFLTFALEYPSVVARKPIVCLGNNVDGDHMVMGAVKRTDIYGYEIQLSSLNMTNAEEIFYLAVKK